MSGLPSYNVQRFGLMWSPPIGQAIQPPEPNRWAARLSQDMPVGSVGHREAGAFTKEQLALPGVLNLLQAGRISVVPFDLVGKRVIVRHTSGLSN